MVKGKANRELDGEMRDEVLSSWPRTDGQPVEMSIEGCGKAFVLQWNHTG